MRRLIFILFCLLTITVSGQVYSDPPISTDSISFSGDSILHIATNGTITSVPVVSFAATVDSLGTALTADYNSSPFGGVAQINLNTAGTATVNLNDLRTGTVYTVQLSNASSTLVTFASDAAEADWRYTDGTIIASDQYTFTVGELVSFYYDGHDMWTTLVAP